MQCYSLIMLQRPTRIHEIAEGIFLRSPFRPSFAGVAPRTALQQGHVSTHTGGFMVYFCRCLARQDGLDGSESGGCEGKMEEGGELKFRRIVFSRVAES